MLANPRNTEITVTFDATGNCAGSRVAWSHNGADYVTHITPTRYGATDLPSLGHIKAYAEALRVVRAHQNYDDLVIAYSEKKNREAAEQTGV